jgi:hypothetical protein
MEDKSILELIKNAKWDCEKISEIKIPITNGLKKIVNKYCNKFYIKKDTFYAKGRFFTEPMINRFNYVECDSTNNHTKLKNFVKSLSSCDSCKCLKKCLHSQSLKDFSLRELYNKYKNIATKFIKIELTEGEQKEFWSSMGFAFMHSIYNYDMKSEIKFSTYIYQWFHACSCDFFNELFTGKGSAVCLPEQGFLDEKQKHFYWTQESNMYEGFSLENELVSDNCYHFSLDFNSIKYLEKNEKTIIDVLYNHNFCIKDMFGSDAIVTLQKEGEYVLLSKILNSDISIIKQIEKQAIEKIKKDKHILAYSDY